MEINITRFFNEACPDDASQWLILGTELLRGAFRALLGGYGAWDDEEIVSWDNQELEALFIQEVTRAIHEFFGLTGGSWEEWQALADEGIVSGRMFRGIDGGIYYYIGS